MSEKTTVTTEEKIQIIRQTIVDRRALAETYRGQAIGNTVYEAGVFLRKAEQCENFAKGLERALLVLFE